MPETAEFSPRGFSRRSVAKAAAWSAPLIVASAATPAFAASPQFTGTLALSARAYALVSLEERTITGTIQTSNGTQPADLTLTATVSGSLTITSAPVVTGPGTFSLKVKAPANATTGTLSVLASNYPQYASASATIETADAGTIIEPGTGTVYALLPMSKNWKFFRTENGVRVYDMAMVVNPAITTYLQDLRLGLYAGLKSTAIPDNMNQNPWTANPTFVYGYPVSWAGYRSVIVSTHFERITSPSRGDLSNDPTMTANAIRTTVGASSWTSSGAVAADANFGTALWVPGKDSAGGAIGAQARGFYLNVPKKPTAGQGGNGLSVTVVTRVTVIGPQGQQVTSAFRYSYMWSGIAN